jgi:hypothetical protein
LDKPIPYRLAENPPSPGLLWREEEEVGEEETADDPSVSAKRRPGAPIGNTNAVKHGLRFRTRGQALNSCR